MKRKTQFVLGVAILTLLITGRETTAALNPLDPLLRLLGREIETLDDCLLGIPCHDAGETDRIEQHA